MPRNERIEAATTGAVVELTNPYFVDQDTIEMDFKVTYNGFADNYTDTIRFARNASTTVKNTSVRTKVNDLLEGIEIGAPRLSNANIQIVGLPV